MNLVKLLLEGGNIFTPDKIIISTDFINWKKRNKYLIGVDSISIPRDKISGVEIQNNIWGVDINITSFGMRGIIAKNFTAADTNKIKQISINK